jgi:regulator of sigma E protease
MVINILIGIVALSVLVLAHELGHFIAAKATRVRVEEFGIGFPPRLLSFKWGETRYSLNAIPFGGFNKLAGEEDPNAPSGLASRGIATRLLVLSAGAIMNLLLPLLLFSIAFMVPHNMVTGQVLVKEVTPDSPAASAGIQAGDILLSINGITLQNTSELSRYIQLNLGSEITLLVEHPDATTENVQLIPRWKPPEGDGAIGVGTITSEAIVTGQSYPFWQAIPMGARDCIEALILYKNGIISTIIGAVPLTVTGPVGIVQITGEIGRTGVSPLLELTAFISIALAITQLLPLPALDGGRIAFVLLEWIRRGKRISPKTERLVHLTGFFMLIALLLVITYQDIARIISGDSFIP